MHKTRSYLILASWLASFSLISAAQAEQAPSQAELQARSWAAACANCHSGSSATGIPSLNGLSQSLIEGKMRAFQASSDKSVMSQLAKGYTTEQIAAIAAYYAKHSSN